MGQKRHQPEEIFAKLRQVDVLLSQDRSVSEAVRTISVTPFTYLPARGDGCLAMVREAGDRPDVERG